jgi:glycine/D-amino acid oxidase-like deaminating enzyme
MSAPNRLPLPDSLYAETARAAVATPPLDGDARASVAIVGGGFTGLSAALHLAEQGVDVRVLEAHEPGWGASGRNGGQVNPGLKSDPDQVERDFGPELGRRMVAMSWNAPNVVFDLVRRHQIQCDASQSGTMRAAYTDGAVTGLRAAHAQTSTRGMPVEFLDAAAMERATGTRRYRAGFLDRNGGHVNPLGYARGLAQAALQAGAKVHGGTPVRAMRRDGTRWRLETPTGTVDAETVILATNGYTDDLWPGLRRSVVPVYSGIVASEPLRDDVARAVLPVRCALYEVGNITVYYRLDARNRVLMGGRCRQADASGPDAFRFLIDYTQRLWPQLKDVRFTHGWNGQVAITADHYPHIHEPAEGVIACLGYNGRGVAMASAMGPLLARRVLGGHQAEIDMPITGIREMPFHGFWKLGVNFRIAYGRIRDSLGL